MLVNSFQVRFVPNQFVPDLDNSYQVNCQFVPTDLFYYKSDLTMCSNFCIVCMSVNHCICVNQPTARQKSSIFFMYISYNRSFLISLNNLFQLSYTVRKFLCKSTYSSRQKSSISCQFLCIIFNIFILKDRFSVISLKAFMVRF